jgi:hypothetical protein
MTGTQIMSSGEVLTTGSHGRAFVVVVKPKVLKIKEILRIVSLFVQTVCEYHYAHPLYMNKSNRKKKRKNYKPKQNNSMHSGRRAQPHNHLLCDSNGNDSMQGEIQPFSLDRDTDTTSRHSMPAILSLQL